ncbi:MAG: hypothetical protein U0R72_19365 [Nakamurella multipartita]
MLTICVVLLLYGGQATDVLRMGTALTGPVAGVLFLHPGERHFTARSSRRETVDPGRPGGRGDRAGPGAGRG